MTPTPSAVPEATRAEREFDTELVEDALRGELSAYAQAHWKALVQRKTSPKVSRHWPDSNCQGRQSQRVAVCAIVRYESIYLHEWVTHHLALGVEKFFVLDDNAGDAFERNQTAHVLAAFGTSVLIVPAEQLPQLVTNDTQIARIGGMSKKQFLWYTACSQHFREHGGKTYDWMVNIDADEFVMPSAAEFCLLHLLHNLHDTDPAAPALMLSRRTFTFSGEREFEDRPVLARFTRAVDTNTVKSIVRTDAVEYCASAHQCEYRGGAKARNLRGKQTAAGSKNGRETLEPVFAPVFLAHYRSKSLSECIWKVVRGYGWMESKSFAFCAQLGGVRDASGKMWARRYQDLLVDSPAT